MEEFRGGSSIWEMWSRYYNWAPAGALIREKKSTNIIADLTKIILHLSYVKEAEVGMETFDGKTSTNQAPRVSQPGEKGRLEQEIELKICRCWISRSAKCR